jgi:hypothetical protein
MLTPLIVDTMQIILWLSRVLLNIIYRYQKAVYGSIGIETVVWAKGYLTVFETQHGPFQLRSVVLHTV